MLCPFGCSILRMQLDVIKGCRSFKSASATCISFWLGNTFLLITNAATDNSVGGISETITPFTVYICAPPTRNQKYKKSKATIIPVAKVYRRRKSQILNGVYRSTECHFT